MVHSRSYWLEENKGGAARVRGGIVVKLRKPPLEKSLFFSSLIFKHFISIFYFSVESSFKSSH